MSITTTPLPLTGKVVLITGGSKGIGKATALRLARDGAKIVFNYSSNTQAANEVVQAIGSENCLAIKSDASHIPSIEKLVEETVSKFGRIDVLIPNAGVLCMADLESVSEEVFERTMAVNVKGPMFLAQKAAPHMGPGSHIIFFSTTQCAASTVAPAYLIYCTSKGAIEQMVRVMSKDLARKGIAVNAIAPGPTGTDLFYEGKSEALLKTIASWSPMNRIGTPEEIANAVAFLSSSDSGWVSGQILRVNGGLA